jgi:hypothetical protein
VLPAIALPSVLLACATAHPGADPRPVNAYVRPLPTPSDLQLLAASEDKKQVPKPKDEPRYKPGTEDKKKEEDHDDSGGFLEGCFDSCLSSFLEGLCNPSGSSESAAPAAAPAPSAVQALVPENRVWTVNDHGWLTVATPGDSVVLMEGPVEPGRPDVDVGHLPAGAEVVVMETHALATGLELRVRPVDGIEPVGWIPGTAISMARIEPSSTAAAPPPPAEPAPSPPAPPPVDSPPKSGIQLVLGAGAFGNRELRDEFKQLGFHGEIGYQRFAGKGWSWGPSVGIWSFSGNARMNYETATALDVPGASEFVIADLALLGGQRYGRRSGFGFGWSAGPALFYVYELSNVRTFDKEALALLGEHDETLGRWTGGGGARVTADWGVSSYFDLGLQADGYVMGWDGQEAKSLTSEFLHVPLRGFDIGLSLTFLIP